MHTYTAGAKGKFFVGYYILERSYGDGDQCVATHAWQCLSTHDNEPDAIKRVNFLNGGDRASY